MVVKHVVWFLLLFGCGLEPLSREQLFGVPSVGLPKVRLTGAVSDAETGAPLAGVSVNLASASTISDDTGTFTLDELATGAFEGSALKTGYSRSDFSVTLSPGTNRLNLALTPLHCPGCATLSGTVTSSQTGGPLANATVSIGAATEVTSAAGVFTFHNLMAGDVEGAVVLAGFERAVLRLTLSPGTNRHDVVLRPVSCGGCTAEQYCNASTNMCGQLARLSFTVISACDGAPLSARASLQGKATCTGSARGGGELLRLIPGGPQVLAVGKANYQAASVMVTLTEGFNSAPPIRLTPIGGCSVTPAQVACECTTPECQ